MRRPKRLPLDTLAPYLLEPASPGSLELLNWPALFGNDHAVELEIGCGKGAYLIDAAAARPEHNFLGLEIDRALQLYVAARLAKRNLTNARMGCADARDFVATRIADAALAAVHVYFPDPWWKKRHHKRRVWTPEFAAQCVRILRPGGRLHLATDVVEYYEIMRALLDDEAGLTRLRAREESGSPRDDELLTNFERKARAKGGAVWRAEYERTMGTAAPNLDRSGRASHN